VCDRLFYVPLNCVQVLGLVGVVTVPRSMPALLLLEYCEHGEYPCFAPINALRYRTYRLQHRPPKPLTSISRFGTLSQGSVDRYLREAQGSNTVVVSMTLRLSFCADVAAGLGYCANRRLVHRDVAARNVGSRSSLPVLAVFALSIRTA
jgi:hypothetical protein